MLALELVLLDHALTAANSVADTVVIALLEKARVVLQPDGQIGAKLRHLEEVDARLTHHLLHQNVVKIFLLDDLSLLVCLVVEHVEGEAVTLGQDLVDEEFVLGVGMAEMDLLLTININMCLVIIRISDRFLRRNKLANIYRRCIRISLEIIRQLLQVVLQIVRVRNLVKELRLFPLVCILHFRPLGLLSAEFLARLRVLLDLHLDKCDLLVAIIDHALGLRVVEQPFGKEVDGLLGLLLVHDGHTLGDNLAQLLALDIVSV